MRRRKGKKSPELNIPPGQRIAIVGSAGSGKTTLAQQLAEKMGIPHIELDAVYWQEQWTPCTPEEFRAKVYEATQGECWIIDGNYSKIRDITWSQADTLIWLDYKIPVVFRRLGRRTLTRLFRKRTLLQCNRAAWKQQFIGRKAQFWQMVRSYRKRRREYPQMLNQPEYAHLTVIRLRSPREAKKWLNAQFPSEKKKSRFKQIPRLKRPRLRRGRPS